jgi:hypothetical protein
VNLLALAAALASIGIGPGPPLQSHDMAVGFTNTTQKAPVVVDPVQAAALESAIDPGGIERFAIQWRLAQPSPSAPPNLDEYDRDLFQPAIDAGLKPLIVLIAAPPWAWGDGKCDPHIAQAKGFCSMPPGDDPADLGSWAAFVRAVAARFGPRSAGIEIWNEENGGGFWTSADGPDPHQYANVLCTAAGAVHQASPGTPVILGGLATSFETDATHISAPEFLNSLYEDPDNDIRGCMDGIGVHPYPGQRPPATIGSPFLTKLAAIREVRAANGDDHPLWITEFGYWTGSPGGVTPGEQAAGLACAVRMAAGMPDVAAFVVHDLVDRGPAQISTGTFGVYANPAAGVAVPKPAAAALGELLRGGRPIPPAPPC